MTKDTAYQAISYNLFVVAWAHLARMVYTVLGALVAGQGPPAAGRIVIALAGFGLYVVASALASEQKPSGPIIALVGPLVGLFAVLVTGSSVDGYQVGVGAMQLGTAYLAWGALTR